MRPFALLGLIVLLLGACDLSSPSMCLPTGSHGWAFRVIPVDSVSGALVVNHVAWVSDGAYVDTLAHYGEFSGLENDGDRRPGIYVLHVEADGYISWILPDIALAFDECHMPTSNFEGTVKLVADGAE